MTHDADFKTRVRERMAATGQPYTAARADLEAERAEQDRQYARTVRIFFDGDTLRSIPSKRKARMVVLLELLRRFEASRDYTEREVSDLLAAAHADYASLRRELVDYGYLTRSDGVYRVADRVPERDRHIVQEAPSDEAARFRANVGAWAREGR